MRFSHSILIVTAAGSLCFSNAVYAQQLEAVDADAGVKNNATATSKSVPPTIVTSESTDLATSEVSPEDSNKSADQTRVVEYQQHEQFQRALPHITEAEELFENDMFESAAEAYHRARDILTGHPKSFQTLFNIGLCYERLSQYPKAIEYYERYLKAAGPRAKNRVEIEKLIKTLKRLLATLRISVNIEASVWIDGELIGYAPGTLQIAGGKHRVALRADGYETEHLQVQVPAQTTHELTIHMRAIGRFQGIDPTYFWISAALVVGAIGFGTYFGIDALNEDQAARSRIREADSIVDDQEIDALLEKIEDSNRRIEDSRSKSDLFFAIGGGLALSSIILFFLSDWYSTEEPRSISRSRPNLSITTRVTERAAYGNLAGCLDALTF